MGGVSRRPRWLALAAALLAVATAAAAAARTSRPGADGPDLLAWQPGVPRIELEAALHGAGWRFDPWGSRGLRVERTVLPGVFAEQRALLELDARDALSGVTIHLLPLRDDRGEALLDLYAEARALLLRRLGRPTWAREEGAGRDLVDARGSIGESWLRCLQWEGPFTVRLGIPRVPTGELRVEIRLATEQLPPPEGYWGREL
jgi:hypothetical protein